MKKSELLGQLEHAYNRLQDALRISLEQEPAIDGTIQRFEFTFELTWKVLKAYLEDQGISSYSPKTCLKEAFKIGWIKNEEGWLILLQARNMTSHVYNEQMAMDIYKEIKKYHSLIHGIMQVLKGQ
jgi:nucleotidyltransferase substrate binding protein (TIGR01987 family)